MNEQQLKDLTDKLADAPFVCAYVEKGEKGALFNFCTNKLDGPTLAYMHSLIGMHLMQGVAGATKAHEAPKPEPMTQAEVDAPCVEKAAE